MRLADRVALVTGSSSGVGAGIAVGMAGEGADVVVNFRTNEAGAERTAARVRELGRRTIVVRADVGSASDVSEMFERIREEFGRLDVLVNNAGLNLRKPFEENDEADWNSTINSNLKSVFLCSRQAIKLMPDGGAILNISSIHAVTTMHGSTIYAASKGGMEAMTRGMAVELGERGIRINAIRLGWVQIEKDHADPRHPDFPQLCERLALGRPGEVEDVAPVAVHLCCDETRFMTGAVLTLDGGHSIQLNRAFAKRFSSSGVARPGEPDGPSE